MISPGDPIVASASVSFVSFFCGFCRAKRSRPLTMLLKTSNSVRQTAVVLCPECVSAALVLVGLELVVRMVPVIISRGERCRNCAGVVLLVLVG